jgi:hypothetical protein
MSIILSKLIHMIKILSDNEYVQVSYNDSICLGKIKWKGSVKTIVYKNAFMVLLDYAKTHRADYFLSDTREQGVVGTENRKWFEEYALPEAIKRGLKKVAVVITSNIFKKYYVNMIFSSTKRFKLPAKAFFTEEETMHWLQSKDIN